MNCFATKSYSQLTYSVKCDTKALNTPEGRGWSAAPDESGRDSQQRQETGAGHSLRDSVHERHPVPNDPSPPRVQQAPDHRADFVEKVEGVRGFGPINRMSVKEEAEVAIDLFGRGVSDPPVVKSISTGTPVPFGEIGGNRTGRSNHLVGDGFEWCWNSSDETDGKPRGFDGFRLGEERVSGERVRHDFLRVVHMPSRTGGTAGVRDREATFRLVLDTGCSTSYQSSIS